MDFLFGGKRKIALIRELIELRGKSSGLSDIEARVKSKELGRFTLISTPESCLVTIIESIVLFQKKEEFLVVILKRIEDHRKRIKGSHPVFKNIIEMAIRNEPMTILDYCYYRISVEHPGAMSKEQFLELFKVCSEVLFSSFPNIDLITKDFPPNIEMQNLLENKPQNNGVVTNPHYSGVYKSIVTPQEKNPVETIEPKADIVEEIKDKINRNKKKISKLKSNRRFMTFYILLFLFGFYFTLNVLVDPSSLIGLLIKKIDPVYFTLWMIPSIFIYRLVFARAHRKQLSQLEQELVDLEKKIKISQPNQNPATPYIYILIVIITIGAVIIFIS